jgi:hypothetical protein
MLTVASEYELERRVLNGLKDILLGNDRLIDEFTAEFKRELARLRKEGHGARRRLLKELKDVERGIRRCLDFITGGDGDPGSVRDQLRRLEARKRDIDADLRTRGHGDRDPPECSGNLPQKGRFGLSAHWYEEMDFDRIIAEAEAQLKARPLRTSLTDAEIKRMGEYHRHDRGIRDGPEEEVEFRARHWP